MTNGRTEISSAAPNSVIASMKSRAPSCWRKICADDPWKRPRAAPATARTCRRDGPCSCSRAEGGSSAPSGEVICGAKRGLGVSIFCGLTFHARSAVSAGTHEPDRVDDVKDRQGQIEDDGEQRQEDSYDGGAGLQQHGGAALRG